MRAPRSHRTALLLSSLLFGAAIGAERHDDALALALSRRASGSWSQAELGAVLRRLDESFDCPIWLDRRVDPTTPLELVVAPTSLADAINRIAEASGLGATRVGALVYVGPSAAALAARPPARNARLRRASVLAWDRLAEPRALAERVARGGQLAIANPEAIPHDLWEAGAWPRLSMADQLSLLLVGFGLTWTAGPANERGIRVTALPSEPGSLTARLRAPRRVPKPVKVTERHTLNVIEKPLEPVAQQLAAAFGLTVRFDATVAAKLRSQRVSLRVHDATSLEVLEALAAAGGLRARSDGDAVVVIGLPGPSNE